MPVNLKPAEGLLPVPGVRLGVAQAGVKRAGRDDLLVLEAAPGSTAAAVFTRNAFCAAPVTLARRHLAASDPRYLLVNSGNANAGTGPRGLEDALRTCAALAEAGGVCAEAVLPFSTGVIGAPLPVDRIVAALPAALTALTEEGWPRAARAIMTTDTVPKGLSVRRTVAGREFTVTGIAKGAGMIRPDMATMLAFLATDAAVGRAGLADLDIGRVRIDVGPVTIVEAGGRAPGYSEEQGRAVFGAPEITIRVLLGRGVASATVWTSDLSYDYVRINAEYRT